LAGEIYRVLR
jgi:hypothetical protein